MATQNLATLLKKAAKTYGDAVQTAKASSFAEFPDGTFIFRWIGFDIKQDKNDQWGVLFQFQSMEGETKDQIYFKWFPLFDYEDENAISRFLIILLEKISGTDAEDLNIVDLEQILKDAMEEDQTWQARLRTAKGKEFQNISLVSKVDTGDYVQEEEEEEVPKKGKAKSTKPAPAVKPTKGKKKSECPVEVEDEVIFMIGSKSLSGTVSAIDEDEETVSVTYAIGTKGATKSVDLAWDAVEKIGSEEEEEEEEGTEYSIGDEVTFTQGDDELTGTILELDDDEQTMKVSVKTGNKKKSYNIDWSDIVSEDEDSEEEDEEEESEIPYEVGDEVTWEVVTGTGKAKKTETKTGTVHSINEEEETCEIKVGGTVKKPILETVDFSDLSKVEEEEEEEDSEEEEEEEEEEVDLEVGNQVEYTDPKTKKPVRGTVLSIDEDDNSCMVKVGATKKKYSIDDLVLVTK